MYVKAKMQKADIKEAAIICNSSQHKRRTADMGNYVGNIFAVSSFGIILWPQNLSK